MLRLQVAVLLVALTAACGGPQDEPADDVLRRQVFAVGTLVEFTLADPPGNARAAIRNAEEALLETEARWRAWDTGELAALNRALQDHGSAQASPELADGIREALTLAAQSGDRFNPAIGGLVELWGFHQEERPDAPPPGGEALRALTEPPVEPAGITVGGNCKVTVSDRRTWLDMGAFAKGVAVEAAIAELRKAGITNAIVNAGGDLKTLGRHGSRDWRIGIRHPSGQGVLAALRIAGTTSVFTSGNYERRFEWEGTRYHHILDPSTGLPARGFDSVTVVHEDAARADAAATALFVAGPAAWLETARAMDIQQAMVVLEDGSIQVTEALRPHLEIETEAPVTVVSVGAMP